MKQALSELISVILQRLEEHPEAAPSESGMRKWLAGQGYNKRDIDAAMRLVGAELSTERSEGRRTTGTVRHLSAIETHKLSREARDALARLEIYELIEPFEREMILERVVQTEGIVTLDELEYLLSWILMGTRDVESQQTIFQVFEGGTGTLH